MTMKRYIKLTFTSLTLAALEHRHMYRFIYMVAVCTLPTDNLFFKKACPAGMTFIMAVFNNRG